MLSEVADFAQLIVAGASIIALFLTLRELKETRQYQKESTLVSRGQITTDVLLSILSNDDERSFFYRLDYEDWHFAEDRFRKTNEERLLDQILHKLSHIGLLIRNGSITTDDTKVIEIVAFTVIGNKEVQKYLVWIKNDAPLLASSFDDAIGLFLLLCKKKAERAKEGNLSEVQKLALESATAVKEKLVGQDFDIWWE